MLVAAILTTTTTTATNVQAQTWFDVGYDDGRSDAKNKVDNNVCPSELDTNDAGCALYRSGYSAGHAARGFLHPEDNNGRQQRRRWRVRRERLD